MRSPQEYKGKTVRINESKLRQMIEEAIGDYYDSLPTDYAYRYGDKQEFDDAKINGFRNSANNPNYIPSKSKDFKTNDGKTLTLRKRGQSHGGKAFSKGQPWTGSHIPTDNEVIMGVPGNQTKWKTGFHGNYSEDFKDFNDIEHGQPLYSPFDENGNTNINKNGIRAWKKEGKGFREI